MLNIIICILVGYLFGSIPTGYLYAKSKGINILEFGSKNPGSTNIKRALGKKAGLIVFYLDGLKVIIPIFVLSMIMYNFDIIKNNIPITNFLYLKNMISIYTGLGCVIGHSYPIYLNFKGGKGITCTMGSILCFNIFFAIFLYFIYKITTKITKYVSVGSITALTFLFVLSSIFTYFKLYPFNLKFSYKLLPGIFFMFIFCIFRHKDNIYRLINGNENKIKD